MAKKTKFGILFVFLLFVFATGCELMPGGDKTDPTDFKRGEAGLEMEFLSNYPGNSYIVSDDKEKISIVIEVRNKGTYPSDDTEKNDFDTGNIYISGFDDGIINSGVSDGSGGYNKMVKTKSLSGMLGLSAASPINPLGGIDTAEFDGEIITEKITVDEYTPTILATVCYPYATKTSPTVCIDPKPFDDRQEKVCNIGSQTLPTQGAPVAVTKIEQEASTDKIQFKIYVKNVGGGDVIKAGVSNNEEGGSTPTLDRCSPLGNGLLDRKDFDRVEVKSIKVGSVDLWNSAKANNKCSPFADGTQNIIRLFNEEGFVICTLTVSDLGSVESAYTTPINIELKYNYRSTISKSIKISKLTTIG